MTSDRRLLTSVMVSSFLLFACGGFACAPPAVSPLPERNLWALSGWDGGSADGGGSLSKTSETQPAGELSSPASSSPTPSEYCADAGSDCSAPQEIFPAEELALLPGEKDEVNRYPSAVMIKAEGVPNAHKCSGVIIGPRLVLTAASCVCERSKSTPGTQDTALIDGSACAKSVLVVTLIQSWPDGPERPRVERITTYHGKVRPHPRVKILLAREHVVSSNADLAVIRLLDKQSNNPPPPMPLALTSAEVGEFVNVVGYDHRAALGGVLTTRLSGKNQVKQTSASGGEEVILDLPQVPTFRGDKGSPVVREGLQGATLVGIVSWVSDQQTSVTGTQAYQPWLRAEILRAARSLTTPARETQP